MLNKYFSILIFCFVFQLNFYTQDLNLLDQLPDSTITMEPVFATFKTVRLGNIQTTECIKSQHLDFRILHRFGNL